MHTHPMINAVSPWRSPWAASGGTLRQNPPLAPGEGEDRAAEEAWTDPPPIDSRRLYFFNSGEFCEGGRRKDGVDTAVDRIIMRGSRRASVLLGGKDSSLTEGERENRLVQDPPSPRRSLCLLR